MDTDVIARIVRSDEAELVVDETDWGLTGIDGADAAKYELFTTKNGAFDGDTLSGKRVASRDLELQAAVMDTSLNAELRRQVKRFFNPKYTYQIYLTYMGTTAWIEAELKAFKAPSKQIDLPQEFSVYFLAVDPYWKSVDDFNQDIAAITPRWGFPYMDHPDIGVLVDVANFSQKVTFNYDGNVTAFPTITITADARVANPKIINGNAFVRLIDELQAGDIVVITTAPQRIRITKNGQNVLNKVDRGSNFAGLALQPGTNVYSFAADYGDNNMHVVIRYNKQYLGV